MCTWKDEDSWVTKWGPKGSKWDFHKTHPWGCFWKKIFSGSTNSLEEIKGWAPQSSSKYLNKYVPVWNWPDTLTSYELFYPGNWIEQSREFGCLWLLEKTAIATKKWRDTQTRVSKLRPSGHFQPVICFYTVGKLRMIFHFKAVEKTQKESTISRHMKIIFMFMKIFWNTVTPFRFHTMTAELRSCDRDYIEPQV